MNRPASIVLFGEGKTEAVFLRHVVKLFEPDLGGTRIKIDAGQGGSPKQVADRLIKKHLTLGNFDRSLLLLDEDQPVGEIPKIWLRRHAIRIVLSAPRCLEGLFLSLLDDPPRSRDRGHSKHWKSRFQKNHLKTDRESEIVARLNKACPSLFPRKMLEKKRESLSPLDAILNFLGV